MSLSFLSFRLPRRPVTTASRHYTPTCDLKVYVETMTTRRQRWMTLPISSPSGMIRFGSTRCVPIQGGVSSTRKASPSPVELFPSPVSFRWPSPSFGDISADVARASSSVFSSGASNVGWKLGQVHAESIDGPLVGHSTSFLTLR